MSLPVAPLGSLPNINLPYQISHAPQRRRNPLEEAIAAMLVGAAGTAGEQLIGNAMTREQVDTFNQLDPDDQRANPSWWKHLLQGPGASEADVMQKRAEMQAAEQAMRQWELGDRQVSVAENTRNDSIYRDSRDAKRQRDLDRIAEEQRAIDNYNKEQQLLSSISTDVSTRKLRDAETNIAIEQSVPQMREAEARARVAEAEASPEFRALDNRQKEAYIQYLLSGGEQRSSAAAATNAKTKTAQENAELLRQILDERGISGGPAVRPPVVSQQSFLDQANTPASFERPAGSDVDPRVVDIVSRGRPPVERQSLPGGLLGTQGGAYGPLSGGGILTRATAPDVGPQNVDPAQVLKFVEDFIQTQGLTPETLPQIEAMLAQFGLTMDDLNLTGAQEAPVEEPMIKLNW